MGREMAESGGCWKDGGVTLCAGFGSINSVGQGAVNMTRNALQHMFDRGHAQDFAVLGTKNNAAISQLEQALVTHISAPTTQVIQGTYRGVDVTHFLDPQSGLNVIRTMGGDLLSGWRLNPAQLQNVITRGKL